MSKGRSVGVSNWMLPIVFLFLTVAIAISGYVYYQKQKKAVIHEQINQLKTIGDLKAIQIRDWLRERIGNSRLILQNPIMVAELAAFLGNRSRESRRNSIMRWMESMQRNYHYENVLLLDRQGQHVLAASQQHNIIGTEGLKTMEAARRRRDTVLSDLHIPSQVSHIYIDTVTPLVVENEIAGFVFLRIDPDGFLYPMIQSWPTPNSTAETLLVERKGDEVVFLNELRHRKNTAMKLRLPISNANLPAVQAALGKTGPFSGRDYRGIAVWSVVRPVPGSPWSIVAKLDREEIERPIRRSALALFLVVLSLILAVALLVLLLWQRQNARYRLRQLKAESQKQALAQHFDYLTRYANDIILLTDEKLNILEANERAGLTYGYGQEALLKMNLGDLHMPEEWDKLTVVYNRTEKKLGAIFETRHRKKDGSVFPVEVSARVIVVDNKKYFQNIVRDISERKQAESKLNEQIMELQRWHNATLGRESRILDLKREVNELLVKAGHQPRYPSAVGRDKQEK